MLSLITIGLSELKLSPGNKFVDGETDGQLHRRTITQTDRQKDGQGDYYRAPVF